MKRKYLSALCFLPLLLASCSESPLSLESIPQGLTFKDGYTPHLRFLEVDDNINSNVTLSNKNINANDQSYFIGKFSQDVITEKYTVKGLDYTNQSTFDTATVDAYFELLIFYDNQNLTIDDKQIYNSGHRGYGVPCIPVEVNNNEVSRYKTLNNQLTAGTFTRNSQYFICPFYDATDYIPVNGKKIPCTLYKFIYKFNDIPWNVFTTDAWSFCNTELDYEWDYFNFFCHNYNFIDEDMMPIDSIVKYGNYTFTLNNDFYY